LGTVIGVRVAFGFDVEIRNYAECFVAWKVVRKEPGED
jgi:hypothetical protein